MSKEYRMMQYFALGSMFLYDSAEIVSNSEMSALEFHDLNPSLIDRVFQEGIGIFNYELSHNQIMNACYCYLQAKYRPQVVSKTAPWQSTLKENVV